MYFLNKILRILSRNDVSKKSSFYWVATKVVIRFFFVPFCLRILWVAWIGKIKLTVFFFFFFSFNLFLLLWEVLNLNRDAMGHCGRQERRILGRILRAVTFQFQHWSNRLSERRWTFSFSQAQTRRGEAEMDCRTPLSNRGVEDSAGCLQALGGLSSFRAHFCTGLLILSAARSLVA